MRTCRINFLLWLYQSEILQSQLKKPLCVEFSGEPHCLCKTDPYASPPPCFEPPAPSQQREATNFTDSVERYQLRSQMEPVYVCRTHLPHQLFKGLDKHARTHKQLPLMCQTSSVTHWGLDSSATQPAAPSFLWGVYSMFATMTWKNITTVIV